MSTTPDRPNPIKDALDVLHQVMSAQRFQAVVERVRKQVKGDKRTKSKWIDTDKFTFKLFEGASLLVAVGEAIKLVPALNLTVDTALGSWRKASRTAVTELANQPLTLSISKRLQEHLQIISAIDAIGYWAAPTSEAIATVVVRSSEPVTLTGTDKDMQALVNDVNRGLATTLRQHQETVGNRLQCAVAAIP